MLTVVSVIGVYSPKANRSEYEAYLAKEVAARNPINFSDETKAFLARVGRSAEIVDLSPDELGEIRKELDRELSGAVLIEVLVSNPDSSFSIGSFVQPNPVLPSGQWQVAWCEKFLTPDGAALLGDFAFNKVPTEKRYRVAFYIHDWKQERGLNGPYGPLPLPPIEPMPSRLWKLAPYEQVD
ncbi:hypothetical protein [Methylibium rhizosphaerae]|uniref:hypothetical protein n=1 Tax=Methylibium rhizosphaerae TaxID=2570323 RepID=UPI001126C3AE|nr:hypothetical protein [Methylibium rhizosphaerae]